ncbi:unnamed protein product [Meloidogyne enterolobii]|uniref:Uncharacterized protein n=1 Tax=Meloidogyne enterolobii TaxID=390850 RepID=A0ACB0YZ82_MELEN
MNYYLIFISTPIVFILLFSVDQTNGYCCTVKGSIGFPPDCNIFGCNCDCNKCDEPVDKACCLVENTGIGRIACSSKKRKRSLKQNEVN